MSINEAFAANMTGKTVNFDVQPYERGIGIIKSITERTIKVKEFSVIKGYTLVQYDVFDLDIEVIEGSATGALWGGVAAAGTVKNNAGTTTFISGVNYGQIYRATEMGETIVIARCG